MRCGPSCDAGREAARGRRQTGGERSGVAPVARPGGAGRGQHRAAGTLIAIAASSGAGRGPEETAAGRQGAAGLAICAVSENCVSSIPSMWAELVHTMPSTSISIVISAARGCHGRAGRTTPSARSCEGRLRQVRCRSASRPMAFGRRRPGRRMWLRTASPVPRMRRVAGGRAPGCGLLTVRPSPPGVWPPRRRRQGRPARAVSASPLP